MDAEKSTKTIPTDGMDPPRISAPLRAEVVQAAYILDVAGRG